MPAFVNDGREPGRRAMARDAFLARAAREGDGPRLLARAHGWSAPVLTLGRTQQPDESLVDAARNSGIEVVRRPTGGGWLLHLPGDLSVTFVVRGPLGPGEFRGAARLIAKAISSGLQRAGRQAVVYTGLARPASRQEICFERADRDEVVVDDVKVAGVALARFGRAALVQTAIPLESALDPAVAGFAERFDPRRASAVLSTAGLDADRLWGGVVEALAILTDEPALPWSWPEPWRAAADRADGRADFSWASAHQREIS